MGKGCIVLLILLSVSRPAESAKYPAGVPKTYTVEGPKALEWMKLLGLNPDQSQNLNLALHPGEVHAQSLPSGTPPANPILSNQISFDPKLHRLTLSGSWLDQTTGSNKDLPRFTFGSASIAEDLSNAGGWLGLLKAWGFPRKRDGSARYGETLEQKSSEAGSFPRLQIRVYRVQSWDKNPQGEWGYQAMIGVDEN